MKTLEIFISIIRCIYTPTKYDHRLILCVNGRCVLTLENRKCRMLLKFLFLAIAVALAKCAPRADEPQLAEPCNADACQLPDCRCFSVDIPDDLGSNDIPQLVLLTFDDAVTTLNYPYYEEAFFERTNPDGCPIGTTYFVSHEYTDYSLVHKLHAHGQEIALHSITHQTMTDYWSELSLDGYLDEFGGGRTIASHFGKIPEEDIKGLRVPFLQLPGNTSFQAIKELGLQYDSSWPTHNFMDPPLWPYTLDFKSGQDCPIGVCPTASLPGVWVQPMVNWSDDNGVVCSMVDSCPNIPNDDVDALTEFMIRNFKRHYESNKAPFGFYVHAAWFALNSLHFDAYKKFLDYLGDLDDVYIVSIQRAIEWSRNPTKLSNLKELWPSCQNTYAPTCVPTSCQLMLNDEYRYMTQCGNCPINYPWLGNPLGQ